MPEWDSYACEIPKPVGFTAKPCSKLTEVHHVIHVPGARRILEDGRIRAGLVYDESRLNRSRLCVAWLSANTWAYGSIYGNVQFTFDWLDIIKGRQVYWVEAMTEYNPSAYRLLLTDRDLAKSKHVQVYDPATDDGPLKRKGSTWYWNGEYTSEFMVEADLLLNLCREVSFIRHHDTICRRNGSSCPDRKASPAKIGGRVMAFILGNAIHGADEALLPADPRFHPDRLSFDGETSVTGIWKALGSKPGHFTGGIKKPASRQALLRGALALHGSDQDKGAKSLVALLAAQDIFEKALCKVVAEHFGFSGYQMPD